MNLQGIQPPNPNLLEFPSGNIIKVTRNSFIDQLHSILHDNLLMQPSNLVFGNKPSTCFKFGDYLGDVHTSPWYCKTQAIKCKNKNDVLIPLIWFIDSSFMKGHSTEPVSFTLGIFLQNNCNTPEAWRKLGLIPSAIKQIVPLHHKKI